MNQKSASHTWPVTCWIIRYSSYNRGAVRQGPALVGSPLVRLPLASTCCIHHCRHTRVIFSYALCTTHITRHDVAPFFAPPESGIFGSNSSSVKWQLSMRRRSARVWLYRRRRARGACRVGMRIVEARAFLLWCDALSGARELLMRNRSRRCSARTRCRIMFTARRCGVRWVWRFVRVSTPCICGWLNWNLCRYFDCFACWWICALHIWIVVTVDRWEINALRAGWNSFGWGVLLVVSSMEELEVHSFSNERTKFW